MDTETISSDESPSSSIRDFINDGGIKRECWTPESDGKTRKRRRIIERSDSSDGIVSKRKNIHLLHI